MKDTVTYPLSSIMDEDEESPDEQLERELAEAQAEIVRLKGEAESWEKVFDRTCEHLADAKEQLRLCNVDQFTTAAELAEAVTKERERCARVSEKYPSDLHTRPEQCLANEIAAAIRKGEAVAKSERVVPEFELIEKWEGE